jgi:integrative and conjugative element protein (TIGR02256 family)
LPTIGKRLDRLDAGSLKDELRSKRSAALPDETGGSLMGMIDFERRRIDVVGALAPPPDSVGTTGSFIRGVSKLKMDIEAAASRAGNQIRYIGEWHSHPEGMSSAPSKTDLAQILKLKHAMEIEGLPAISVIVAEKSVSVLIGGPEGAVHG